MEQMRINKFLAHCGVCSRRMADELILQGKVLVNGVAAGQGQLVTAQDRVTVSGKHVESPEKTVVLAYYKPAGVTCTERDPHAEVKISDVIDYPVRVTYAGRLDRDSEGLMLLTNDGDLIQAMMRGSNRHEKEYEVVVDKEITADFLNRMSSGIYLEELGLRTRRCSIKKTEKNGFNIILTQGLNRQIRRMCEACGYRVRSIRRVRVMDIRLGSMKPGEYFELPEADVERLYRELGIRQGI